MDVFEVYLCIWSYVKFFRDPRTNIFSVNIKTTLRLQIERLDKTRIKWVGEVVWRSRRSYINIPNIFSIEIYRIQKVPDRFMPS